MQFEGLGPLTWPSPRARHTGGMGAPAAFADQLQQHLDDMAAVHRAAVPAGAPGTVPGSAPGTVPGAVSGNGAAGSVPVPGAVPAAGAAGAVPGASAATAADTQDRFLKLLVAQLKNQDPLNPVDNSQVTSQMAQISTVQGIENLNRTMTDFARSNGAGSAAGSVGLLGHSVLSAGETFQYVPGTTGAATVGFQLQGAAKTVQVDIVDGAGRVVSTQTLTDQLSGTHTVAWDGRDMRGNVVPAGPVSVRVSATDGQKPVDATALVPRRVTGLTQTAAGVQLQLEGGSTTTPADVQAIF